MTSVPCTLLRLAGTVIAINGPVRDWRTLGRTVMIALLVTVVLCEVVRTILFRFLASMARLVVVRRRLIRRVVVVLLGEVRVGLMMVTAKDTVFFD